MALQDVQTELATRLPAWQGGGWKDLSGVNGRGDVILRLGRGTFEEPGEIVYESNMSEHSMTVEQVLDVFASGAANSVRVMKQYMRGG